MLYEQTGDGNQFSFTLADSLIPRIKRAGPCQCKAYTPRGNNTAEVLSEV